jgi:hypothetical protein
MCHCMIIVGTDVSDEHVVSIFRVKIKAIYSSETSFPTRATRRHIRKDDILHSHRRETFISYTVSTGWNLQRRRNVSPVSCELDPYISDDGILHSHRRESLTAYMFLSTLLPKSNGEQDLNL